MIYNNESINIVTRFRIKGFKKHFDVAADIFRDTASDEQTFINKIENKGNKAIIEVVNIIIGACVCLSSHIRVMFRFEGWVETSTSTRS